MEKEEGHVVATASDIERMKRGIKDFKQTADVFFPGGAVYDIVSFVLEDGAEVQGRKAFKTALRVLVHIAPLYKTPPDWGIRIRHSASDSPESAIVVREIFEEVLQPTTLLECASLPPIVYPTVFDLLRSLSAAEPDVRCCAALKVWSAIVRNPMGPFVTSLLEDRSADAARPALTAEYFAVLSEFYRVLTGRDDLLDNRSVLELKSGPRTPREARSVNREIEGVWEKLCKRLLDVEIAMGRSKPERFRPMRICYIDEV